MHPCKDFPTGEEFLFEAKNDQKSQYIIGRDQNQAFICLKELNISGVHARIEFQPKYGWLIYDGSSSRPSVNGTFVMLQNKVQRTQKQESNPLKIWDGMVFCVSGTHFTCKITPKKLRT